MSEILLKTENLSKTFSNGGLQQHVLKNIGLELYRGDFTVIMGASGAGKSTLLYALSGMDNPTLRHNHVRRQNNLGIVAGRTCNVPPRALRVCIPANLFN